MSIYSSNISSFVTPCSPNNNIHHHNTNQSKQSNVIHNFFNMQFTKITLFSLIAIAAAVPNPLPEAEPALEARTWGYNYHDNICDCQCSRNGNHKRELDTRTFTIITKILCYKKCKKECDEYYDSKS